MADAKDQKQPGVVVKPKDKVTESRKKLEDSQETLGYEYFPSRDANADGTVKKQGWWRAAWDFASGTETKQLMSSLQCQHRVIKCIEENYMVKLLVNALKSKGCELKLSRHVSCESCGSVATGGYDAINKQVVVCSNNSVKDHTVCNVLSHELIHAFDDCRAKMDIVSNIDHLACTEIRAANLMHCNMKSSLMESPARSWGALQQQECVRWKARNSVLAVRNITKEEADEAIDRVFPKCYPDLEPVGRIPRNPHTDGRRLYVEASLYGYTEAPNLYTHPSKQ